MDTKPKLNSLATALADAGQVVDQVGEAFKRISADFDALREAQQRAHDAMLRDLITDLRPKGTVISSDPRETITYAELEKIVCKQIEESPNKCGEVVLSMKPRGTVGILRNTSEGIHPPIGGWKWEAPTRPKEMFKIYGAGTGGGKSFFGSATTVLKGRQAGLSILDEYANIVDSQKEDSMAAQPLSPNAQAELEKLVVTLNDYFDSANDETMLLGPAMLTVDTGAKGYRKKNFLGGETFTYGSVRVGVVSRGSRLIFVLKPEGAADYVAVELTDQEAINQLQGFRSVMDRAVGGDGYVAELQRIRHLDDQARADVAAVQKMEEYKEFGAWVGPIFPPPKLAENALLNTSANRLLLKEVDQALNTLYVNDIAISGNMANLIGPTSANTSLNDKVADALSSSTGAVSRVDSVERRMATLEERMTALEDLLRAALEQPQPGKGSW